MYKNGSYRIRDTWHGEMLYSVDDTFIGTCLDKYGEWCADEIRATLEWCTDVVLDIGANIGTHTLSYAKQAKQVFCFEPQQVVYNMLCANIALNRLDNVRAIKTALGNRTGLTNIFPMPHDFIGNFGSSSVGHGTALAVMRTLDEYDFQDVSLIKIDVEGSEVEVLEGAKETINRCKPVIYIENDRKEKQDTVCRMIESLGYRWNWHYAMLFKENNYRDCQEDIFQNIAGINMLCFPKE